MEVDNTSNPTTEDRPPPYDSVVADEPSAPPGSGHPNAVPLTGENSATMTHHHSENVGKAYYDASNPPRYVYGQNPAYGVHMPYIQVPAARTTTTFITAGVGSRQYTAYASTPACAAVSMPSAQTTVMIARQHNLMSPRPMQMQCPNCNASVVTMTERVTGTMVYALALVLCVVGCFAGCCLLPFFIPELKDVHHYCPTCRYHIGIYKKDFG